jgi:alkylation response protein AidB-like acyl-CoA dehydrogenase
MLLSERGNGFKICHECWWSYQIGCCLLDAQRRDFWCSAICNERIQFNTAIAQFGAVRSKLAEMATSCYAGESASYRAADIEDRIIAREAEGISHQEEELKGLKNMLSMFRIESGI